MHQTPENMEYLSLHSQPAKNALRLFHACSDERFEQALLHVLMLPESATADDIVAAMHGQLHDVIPRPLSGSGSLPPITFVTGNKQKLEELRQLIGADFPFEVVNQSIDLQTLQRSEEK